MAQIAAWTFCLALPLAVATAGCTSGIAVEVVAAKATVNEIAAAHMAEGKRVDVGGIVVDISLYGEDLLVTTGTASSAATQLGAVAIASGGSVSTTKRMRAATPYVKLTASDGTSVFCFLSKRSVNNGSVDRLEKGKRAKLSGRFKGFSRDHAGALQVSLSGCWVPDDAEVGDGSSPPVPAP